MGTRELLLSVAAVALFALTTLNINRLTNAHAEDVLQRQMEFVALSIAQDLIEEAKTKAFDENAVNSRPASIPGGFSGGPLGPDGTETDPNFDDVDDYNGLSRTVPHVLSQFEVSVTVDYVEDTAPSVVVSTKTFYKRMVVSVSSPYLENTIQVSHLFTFMENY